MRRPPAPDPTEWTVVIEHRHRAILARFTCAAAADNYHARIKAYRPRLAVYVLAPLTKGSDDAFSPE